MKTLVSVILPLLLALWSTGTEANEVEIVMVKLTKQGKAWHFRTTLRHADTGWKHYADGWRVVSAKGKVLGHRKLWHPHVDEQPFTRGLEDVVIPGGTQVIYVEAHDNVHGWSKQRVRIDLGKMQGERYRIGAR